MTPTSMTLRGILAMAVFAVGMGSPAPDLAGTDGPAAPAAYYLTGNDAAAPEPDVVSLAQQDKSFRPNLVSVTVGGTVEFPNRDDVVHNVYGPKKGALGFFDLGSAEQTQPDNSNLLTKTMPEAGVVPVSCAVHPVMKSTIFVVPSPFHTVSTDGSYTFSDVPPGEYNVKVMRKTGAVSTLKTVQIE